MAIIDFLLLESVRKGPDKGKVFAREVKLVNQLFPLYPDLGFWLGLNLGFHLHSLAWFKMEGENGGKWPLEIAWRYHKLVTGAQNELDKRAKSAIVEGELL